MQLTTCEDRFFQAEEQPQQPIAKKTAVKLIPFDFSSSILNVLATRTDYFKQQKSKLLFILVIKDNEEVTKEEWIEDIEDVRYTLIRKLYKQLQRLTPEFTIETAVGHLCETTLAYAKQYQPDEIILPDIDQQTSLNIQQHAVCKTTCLTYSQA